MAAAAAGCVGAGGILMCFPSGIKTQEEFQPKFCLSRLALS